MRHFDHRKGDFYEWWETVYWTVFGYTIETKWMLVQEIYGRRR